MKIKDGFVMRESCGAYVVVAVGDMAEEFEGMISLNYTGKLMWEGLSQGKSIDEIAESIMKEFKVDNERVVGDIEKFIARLKDANILDE